MCLRDRIAESVLYRKLKSCTHTNFCKVEFQGFYAGGPTGATVDECSVDLDVGSAGAVGPKSKSAFTWMCGFSTSAGTGDPVDTSKCSEP